MRASGMSVLRVSLPVLFFALFLSATTFFIQEKVLLYSQKKVDDIKIKFIKKDFSAPEEGNFAFHSKDMIIFTAKFIPKNKLLQDVIIFKEDNDGNITQKTIAQTITYKEGTWLAQNVIEYSLDNTGTIIGIPAHSAEKTIDIEEKPEELAFKKSILTQFATLKDLRKEIRKLTKIKAYSKLSNLIIDAYNKIADPFAHLFLVIGVLPFALEIKKRKVGLSSLGIGFIFWFLYYYVASLSTAFGKTGIILPICSPWIGPLFFVTVGITGLLLIR
jgi:lipopolysaccharide export system permease protein